MIPPPTDPFSLHARMMDAIIDDILDPNATSFVRLDALRETLNQTRGDLASPTVAGAPSGLSPSRSQAKPLIDYREKGQNQ